jgi:hypothetical protein
MSEAVGQQLSFVRELFCFKESRDTWHAPLRAAITATSSDRQVTSRSGFSLLPPLRPNHPVARYTLLSGAGA